MLSHDLRNPLHVAKAHLDAGSKECDSEHLDTIAASHDRMETLLSEVLTLARQGRTVDTRKHVGLEAITTAAWETSETADASLTVVDDFALSGDAERIQQAFENLFANAVHHGGDTVTVEVGPLDSGGLYIADDGPGIPEEARADVFAAGYTTADEGTGLGLATVRRIVEAHGWSIEVTESAGGGARFEVTGVTALD